MRYSAPTPPSLPASLRLEPAQPENPQPDLSAPHAAVNRSQLCFLFPTAVQISQTPDAAAVNAGLLAAADEVRRTTPNTLPASRAGHLYPAIRSLLDLLERPEFAVFTQHVLTEANRFAASLRLDTRRFPLRIDDCWLNVYGTGDAQEIHDHANSVISGVYYVKAPPGSSPLTFHAPMAESMVNAPYREMTDINCSDASFEAVEGRMILFRSWLRHSVKPSKIRGERVSIAFNLTM